MTEGPTASEPLGSALLRGTARDLWMKALRQAPPQAMPFSLDKLKVPDGRDPGANVVWAPAWHLAGAPRRFVWLVGLTSGGWPRPVVGDALLPRHLLGRVLRDPTITECDRQDFATVAMAATGALVLSRAARSAQGGVLAPSPLLPTDVTADVVDQRHVPIHAYSEADRVLARLDEAGLIGSVALARACTSSGDTSGSALTTGWYGPGTRQLFVLWGHFSPRRRSPGCCATRRPSCGAMRLVGIRQ